MKVDKLKEFIKFMEDNNLSELEIEEEGQRIRLKKNLAEQQLITPSGSTNLSEAKKEIEHKDNTAAIISPMVGTFYRAAAPGAKPYTDIGEKVKPGDVICIIEAMKLMNEIKAEISGKIVQIPVENGEAVEFGQTLFLIEPV